VNEKTKQGSMGADGQKDFTIAEGRPLPVVLLADVSGSMAADGKIDALNLAVREMVEAFGEEDDDRTEIRVAVVTFGGDARLHTPLTAAKGMQWMPMAAAGMTPMGAALDIATRMLEDRTQVPSRAYTPTVILASDGQPNDEWRGPLARFLGSERARKAQRFALAIGADADHAVLREFLAAPEARVFEAHEAREIRKFFRWVTMSVTMRSRSVQPNESIALSPLDIEDYGDF
jgi:uncharacterized protein YegL